MNPMPYSTPPQHRPPVFERCDSCHPHQWHGLKCTTSGCSCESSWRDPETGAA